MARRYRNVGWLPLLIGLLLTFGGCGERSAEPLPPIVGPALLFFYTDN